MENIFDIPPSLAEKYEMSPLPESSRKMLIISDLHIPYHDVDAVNACFEYARKEHVDTVLMNGDVLDFYRLSRFIQDPSKIMLKDEMECGQKFLDALQSTFRRCGIYYKIGNHEDRLTNYLKTKAPELWGLPYFDFGEFLELKRRNIELIDSTSIALYGKLPIIHGHELRMNSGGVNPARSLFLKFKTSAACSHLHRTSDHTETTGMGKTISTHSIGCLCDLHPEYARINNWNHGFAIVEKNEMDEYEFRNYKIIKGKVV